MGHHDVSFLHQLALSSVAPHTMGHDSGRLTKQSVTAISVAIACAVGFELMYPCYF